MIASLALLHWEWRRQGAGMRQEERVRGERGEKELRKERGERERKREKGGVGVRK